MEKKRKSGSLFIYLFCPGTTCPFEVVTTLLPLHSPSCCPGGAFPSGEFLHSSAAETGTATDDTSIATASATAIAASVPNVSLLVFIYLYRPYNTQDKRLIRYF
jgi:hypothetical protein